jgi:undecaprenyl-diphosphatase
MYGVAGAWIEASFESLTVVGMNLLVTAAVLTCAMHAVPGRKSESELRLIDALVIGMAQGAALLPGISRSGMTIAAGLSSGLRSDVAVRFACLLTIPAIVGAELAKLPLLLALPASEAATLGAGVIVSAVTGWVAIDVLLRLVRRGKLGYFAIYCGVAGTLTMGTGLGGWGGLWHAEW